MNNDILKAIFSIKKNNKPIQKTLESLLDDTTTFGNKTFRKGKLKGRNTHKKLARKHRKLTHKPKQKVKVQNKPKHKTVRKYNKVN